MTAFGTVLWQPDASRRDASAMQRFLSFVNERHGQRIADYPELHAWSIGQPNAFWQAVADFTGVIWQQRAASAFVPPPKGKMRGAKWFDGARLNFAENLLPPASDDIVVVALAEGARRRTLTARELREAVARCRSALKALGVGKGDRVAGVVANVPEALIAMLGATSLGAIWSSCSPDFGAPAIIDRLGQVAPKVLFVTCAYRYGGKLVDALKEGKAAAGGLPSVTKVVAVSHLDAEAEPHDSQLTTWQSFLDGAPKAPLAFEPMAFDDPVYILFSSGTTGVPKCITHGVGGTLLQHKKELVLHGDVGPESRLLYYTTCGWMMWNWMASALAAGASVVLYEGSVAFPDLSVLWRTVNDERVTAFGTSPKFVAACQSAKFEPRQFLAEHKPRTIFSTGSPLNPEQFQWLYDHVDRGIHLASISGGTDIVSCFMLGNPMMPVRAGEIQYAGLGMAIDAWDDGERPVRGEKGELVCTRPFPSMPVKFWNDPDGKKYDRAYFSHYDPKGRGEVWRHGDFVEITAHGGIIVHGRSDATLNPGGVRIGTAELYRALEAVPEVEDAVAIGRREKDGDTAVLLFVKLRGAQQMSETLTQRIKATLRASLTPRHVPKEIIAVKDIPYTRSGKKMEIAVTEAVHGEPVKNLAAVANPECMAEYEAYFRASSSV